LRLFLDLEQELQCPQGLQIAVVLQDGGGLRFCFEAGSNQAGIGLELIQALSHLIPDPVNGHASLLCGMVKYGRSFYPAAVWMKRGL